MTSVKPNKSGRVLASITFQPGGRFTSTNVTLRELIRAAYGDRFVGFAPRFVAGGVSMAQLATSLSRQVNRIVVDRTGLSGTFDFELQWTPDGLPQRAPGTPADQPLRLNGVDVDPNGISIFTALQEQLGLRLEPTTGPVEVLVIDQVEPPTPD